MASLQLRGVFLVSVLFCCFACNRTSTPEAQKPRYQITIDKRGNTLRVDTLTGERTRIQPQSTAAKGCAKSVTAPPKRSVPAGEPETAAVRPSEAPGTSPSIETAPDAAPTADPTRITELSRAVANLSGGAGCGPDARRAFVMLKSSDAFMKGNASSQRLATIAAGARVIGILAEGDWRLVRFTDPVWGERAGYVRCSALELASPNPVSVASASDISATNADISVRRERAPDLTVDPRQKRETVRGYLEWQKGSYAVVDGQRVRWTSGTRLQLGRLPFVSSIPAGYEVAVVGRRARDGSLIAERLDAKPKVIATEGDLVQRLNDVERAWLANGVVSLSDGKELRNVGRIDDTSPDAERVRRIMQRILPPYLDPARIRTHVIQSDDWNAHAMANGTVWVNIGLLNAASDDEVAVILGHELAHYTYAHSPRSMNNDLWRLAWASGYSRNLEDQADRVGLRYAYEGGFNVERAIDLLSRARSRFGESGGVTNWSGGDRSRALERIKNLRRELEVNYRP